MHLKTFQYIVLLYKSLIRDCKIRRKYFTLVFAYWDKQISQEHLEFVRIQDKQVYHRDWSKDQKTGYNCK